MKNALTHWIALILSSFALIMTATGCPECNRHPVLVKLVNADGTPVAAELVESVEYSHKGGDFKACDTTGLDRGEATCGAEMSWGCTGPDEGQFKGEYTVTALIAGAEWQGSGTVGDIVCTEYAATIEIVVDETQAEE